MTFPKNFFQTFFLNSYFGRVNAQSNVGGKLSDEKSDLLLIRYKLYPRGSWARIPLWTYFFILDHAYPHEHGSPTHEYSANSSASKNATSQSAMQERGDLVKTSCKIEYFLRTMKYLKFSFAELREIQNILMEGNLDTIEKLKIGLETNETVNLPPVPSKPEMVRSIFLDRVHNFRIIPFW